MSFILADACVVTVNSANDVYERGSVLVRGDRISDLGLKTELTAKEPNAEVIDCACNTHTHLFQTLLKGPGDDMALKDWFTRMTGPAAVELTAADIHDPRSQGGEGAAR
jgi:5-methylthioadenosine/S-adenosylhomocysteine deaminase